MNFLKLFSVNKASKTIKITKKILVNSLHSFVSNIEGDSS